MKKHLENYELFKEYSEKVENRIRELILEKEQLKKELDVSRHARSWRLKREITPKTRTITRGLLDETVLE
jgi:hypothetical protein